MARAGRIGAALGLGIVLACLSASLLAGLAQKQPCASGSWGDLRQYRLLCYSDIVPLYGSEPVQDHHAPYLSDCPGGPGATCNEYPVLTMYAMKLAALPVDTYSGFFYANAVLLILAAFVTGVALWRVAGRRALYFALAPTLLIYGFVNWDLFALAFATAATLAFVRRWDAAAGILLGLGAATKFYPALLLVPFAAERVRTREFRRVGTVLWWAAWAWVVANGPFMILKFHNWSTFFTFNKGRSADFDSLWFIACDHLHGKACLSTKWLNNWSILAFVGLSALVWFFKVRRHPDTPRWQLGFAILVAFLLTNKVYSPQYGLWLLPWFALSLPSVPLFIAFEVTDVAVFVTRFAWFGQMAPGSNGWVDHFTTGPFQLALLARAAVLLVCLVAFVVRRPAPVVEPIRLFEPEPAPLPAGT